MRIRMNLRLALASSTLFLLLASGCASLPEQQAFNRSANSGIKTIAVLETQRTELNVMLVNNPAASFGLIGGLVAAADQSSKEGKFRAIVAKTDFQPLPYFRDQLTRHMEERGYTLVWPTQQVQAAKVDRSALGLRKTYARTAIADAQMDVNFGFVGYAAAGAGKSAPYRPTVTTSVRLVSQDGKQNLFTDYVAMNNVFNMKNAVVLEADSQFAYPGFSDLEAAGTTSVEGLKQAIDRVALKISQQISGMP